MHPPAINLTLNSAEFSIVMEQDPASRSDGGYQSLLVTLQDLTDGATHVMVLPRHLLPRIQRYAFEYGNGGWEERLKAIFERHLGSRLDNLPE